MGGNSGTHQSAGTLVLFFTLGESLQSWSEAGILEREVAIYNAMAPSFDRIYLLTYGGNKDLELANEVLQPNIVVIPRPRVLGSLVYSFLAPFIRRKQLHTADFFKTNQMLGAWTAVIAKYLYPNATLIVRTGYWLSFFLEQSGKSSFKCWAASRLEKWVYQAADGILSTSIFVRDMIRDRYSPGCPNIVITNYVDTDKFRPLDVESSKGSVCYVGRLATQKKVQRLLGAVRNTPYEVTVIGDGSQRECLKRYARQYDIPVDFRGRVPNRTLPKLLNRHEVFVLPSEYEGMPKSLLEAMSCGMAVIGTDVPGIREVIAHGETGLLCEPKAAEIGAAVERIMDRPALKQMLGDHARKYIVCNHSLETVVADELSFYEQVVLEPENL